MLAKDMTTIEVLEGMVELLTLDNQSELMASGQYLIASTVLSDRLEDSRANDFPKAYALLKTSAALGKLKETITQLKLLELLED